MSENWSTFFHDAATLRQQAMEQRAKREAQQEKLAAADRDITSVSISKKDSITTPDSGVEHGVMTVHEGQINDGYDTPKVNEDELPDHLGMMTDGERAMSQRRYIEGAAVVRTYLRDFDQALDKAGEAGEINPAAGMMIMQGNLPNGPVVAYYLAKHQDELARINAMGPKQAQRAVLQLSEKLTRDYTIGLDQVDYATFRKLRYSN